MEETESKKLAKLSEVFGKLISVSACRNHVYYVVRNEQKTTGQDMLEDAAKKRLH